MFNHWMIVVIVLVLLLAGIYFYINRFRPGTRKAEDNDWPTGMQADRDRKASRKGEIGEFKIEFQLERLPQEYRCLSNVLLKTSRGLTQIDHIIVSPYGIFVVETKNYSGWFFGSQYDKYWTQTFNRKRYKILNPIRQNYGHIQAIRELLPEYKDLKFYSVIVFSRRCELREINLKAADDILVIFDTEFTNVILRKNKEIYLSPLEVKRAGDMLAKANITDEKIRREHLKRIKEKY